MYEGGGDVVEGEVSAVEETVEAVECGLVFGGKGVAAFGSLGVDEGFGKCGEVVGGFLPKVAGYDVLGCVCLAAVVECEGDELQACGVVLEGFV